MAKICIISSENSSILVLLNCWKVQLTLFGQVDLNTRFFFKLEITIFFARILVFQKQIQNTYRSGMFCPSFQKSFWEAASNGSDKQLLSCFHSKLWKLWPFQNSLKTVFTGQVLDLDMVVTFWFFDDFFCSCSFDFWATAGCSPFNAYKLDSISFLSQELNFKNPKVDQNRKMSGGWDGRKLRYLNSNEFW